MDKQPHVVVSREYKYMCSDPGQDLIISDIKEQKLNRVVVAACSPRIHELTFRKALSNAGLNPYLFEMANIRNQNSWMHFHEPEQATEKAKDLVRMAVAKAAYIEPLHQVSLDVKRAALVVGGGVAGMEDALGIADQGFQAYLVERGEFLGGNALWLRGTWQGEKVSPYVESIMTWLMTTNIDIRLKFYMSGKLSMNKKYLHEKRLHTLSVKSSLWMIIITGHLSPNSSIHNMLNLQVLFIRYKNS